MSVARKAPQFAEKRGNSQLARLRSTANVVRFHRASKAAYVFSEIAKSHITHPLPDQLQLAEEDLRSALDDLPIERVAPIAPHSWHSKHRLPSRWQQAFVIISACGFWTMIVLNVLRFFGVL